MCYCTFLIQGCSRFTGTERLRDELRFLLQQSPRRHIEGNSGGDEKEEDEDKEERRRRGRDTQDRNGLAYARCVIQKPPAEDDASPTEHSRSTRRNAEETATVPDVAVCFRNRPMQIVANLHLIGAIGEFFKPPLALITTEQIDRVTFIAIEQARRLQQASRGALHEAWGARKTVALDVRVMAPTIIVPLQLLEHDEQQQQQGGESKGGEAKGSATDEGGDDNHDNNHDNNHDSRDSNRLAVNDSDRDLQIVVDLGCISVESSPHLNRRLKDASVTMLTNNMDQKAREAVLREAKRFDNCNSM